ncbi:MOSC domain-containing protein [Ferrovibrio sp.]|uniref:MOSC domain-containing protein n=1 Tax=Ferrovibrio sp. TaxID=1917215 RepID=UPI0035B02A13
MSIHLAGIQRFPVKGLSPQPLDSAQLGQDAPLPGDRRFALAHGASAFDAAQPAWQKKAHFLNGARNPALAKLKASYDESGTRISLASNGASLLEDADLLKPEGRAALADALLPLFEREARGKLMVAVAPGVSFADVQPGYLSIQNRASLDDFSDKLGQYVDARRMRGNLLLEGAAAWDEMHWPGRRFRLGGAELDVVEIIGRCANTTLNPDSGERDIETLDGLQRFYGHTDCGVYARVTKPGRIMVGDSLTEI